MKNFFNGLSALALLLSPLLLNADEQAQPDSAVEPAPSSQIKEPDWQREYKLFEDSLIYEERILPMPNEVLPPLPPLPGSRQRWRSQLPSLDGTPAEVTPADGVDKPLQPPPREPRQPRQPASVTEVETAPPAVPSGVDQPIATESSTEPQKDPQQVATSAEAVTVNPAQKDADAIEQEASPASPPAPPAPAEVTQLPAAIAPTPLVAEQAGPESSTTEPPVSEPSVNEEPSPENIAVQEVALEEAAPEAAAPEEAVPEEAVPEPVLMESVDMELVEEQEVPVTDEAQSASQAEPVVQAQKPPVVTVAEENTEPAQLAAPKLEAGGYVVQLGAFKSQQKMENYIARRGLPSVELSRYITQVKGVTWHVITWGVFADRASARKQWQQQGIPDEEVWIRSTESLQAVLKDKQ